MKKPRKANELSYSTMEMQATSWPEQKPPKNASGSIDRNAALSWSPGSQPSVWAQSNTMSISLLLSTRTCSLSAVSIPTQWAGRRGGIRGGRRLAAKYRDSSLVEQVSSFIHRVGAATAAWAPGFPSSPSRQKALEAPLGALLAQAGRRAREASAANVCALIDEILGSRRRNSDDGSLGFHNESIIATGSSSSLLTTVYGHRHCVLTHPSTSETARRFITNTSTHPPRHHAAVAPSSHAQEVADRLSQAHEGIETHVVPLPSVDLLSSWLRRDLESVRSALVGPTEGHDNAIQHAMGALPRARRLASILEGLVPLLSTAAALESAQPALKKAPKSVVDKLPCRVFTSLPHVTRECYICLDTYTTGDKMRQLPCKHEFHAKCVDRWLLDVSRTCPCCRAEVCLDSVEANAEDEVKEAGTATNMRTSYDELWPSPRRGRPVREVALRTEHNGALNGALTPQQAQQQMDYLQSRNTLSHSISQLQMLRSRQASLVHERQRLEVIPSQPTIPPYRCKRIGWCNHTNCSTSDRL